MIPRLRGLTLAALIGYGLASADRSYGHAPILCGLLVAGVAWTAGWMQAAIPLTEATATAQRDCDLALARIAQLEDGGSYVPVRLVPRQAQR